MALAEIVQSSEKTPEASTVIAMEEKKHLASDSSSIILIPTPSDDPKDPLNWPMKKKLIILAILSLAAFSGTASTFAGQLALSVQAELYHKTLTQLSYSQSAGLAGLAVGPLLFAPFVQLVGRSSVIFFSLLGAMACSIWATQMTSPDQYISFVISRLFNGLFGAVPGALGARCIIEIFFLHQRGKAFSVYTISVVLGTVLGPSFGGFIVGSSTWPIAFWWTFAVLALSALLSFLFLDETSYDRRGTTTETPKLPTSWIGQRFVTFFLGNRITPQGSSASFFQHAFAPIFIGLSPVGICIGVFGCIMVGWGLMIDVMMPVFLQTPVKFGGYGFDATQNAAFTLAHLFGLILAQVYGIYVNDRLPLYMCRKYRGGIWAPELRLTALVAPTFVLPIALGLIGAGLQYHIHFMILVFGVLGSAFATYATMPICINYLVENFTDFANEASIIFSVYRLGWGVSIPFFVDQWEAAVTIGWVMGTAAFTTFAMDALAIFLYKKGHMLRELSINKKLVSTEEGEEFIHHQDDTLSA